MSKKIKTMFFKLISILQIICILTAYMPIYAIETLETKDEPILEVTEESLNQSNNLISTEGINNDLLEDNDSVDNQDSDEDISDVEIETNLPEEENKEIKNEEIEEVENEDSNIKDNSKGNNIDIKNENEISINVSSIPGIAKDNKDVFNSIDRQIKAIFNAKTVNYNDNISELYTEIEIKDESTIVDGIFEFIGIGKKEIPEDWKFVEGDLNYTKFPDFNDCSFVNATVNGVPIIYLGTIEVETVDGEGNTVKTQHYYYLTNESQDTGDVTVSIVPEGTYVQLNYGQKEFKITYELEGAIDEIKKDLNVSTLDEVKEYIFGTNVQYRTTSRSYLVNVTIPNGYIGDVIRYTLDENGNRSQEGKKLYEDNTNEDYKHEPYPLGTDPSYENDGDQSVILKKDSPTKLILSDTYFDNEVSENRVVVVTLTKKASPTFDASFWLKTVNAKGRGSTGTDDPNYGLFPNINTADNWNWNNNNGTYINGPISMDKNDDGTYSHTLVFQTNSESGGYILNGLELNGQAIEIPFVPAKVYASDNKTVTKVAEKIEDTMTITELPDGTLVTVEFIREFHYNSVPQRAYRVTITGARSNITVTGGNLKQGTGAAEVIVDTLVGIDYVESLSKNSTEKKNFVQSDVIVNCDYIKFTIGEYYEYAKVLLTDVNGNEIKGISINISEDGKTYTITGKNEENGENDNIINHIDKKVESDIGLLTIIAVPKKYAIQYNYNLSGPEDGKLDTIYQFDDNNEDYYTIDSGTVTINKNAPIDIMSRTKVFSGWKSTDGADFYPNQILTIAEVASHAESTDTVGEYVLVLNAQWDTVSQIFTYYVSVKITDKNGNVKTLDDILQVVTTHISADTEEAEEIKEKKTLTVTVNKDAEGIKDWIAKHPYYILDDSENGNYVFEVTNGGIVYLHFIEAYGGLHLSKVVEGDEREVGDNKNTFYFTIEAQKTEGDDRDEIIKDGTYYALSYEYYKKTVLEGSNNTNNKATSKDLIPIEFISGKGTIGINGGDDIILNIPVGKYKVTEESNANGDEYYTYITVGEEKIEGNSTDTVVLAEIGNESEKILFTNVLNPAYVTITKQQDPPDGTIVAAGQEITYTITVENDERARAHDVVVTDAIPSGLENITLKSCSYGTPKIENNVITWTIGNLEKKNTKENNTNIPSTNIGNDGDTTPKVELPSSCTLVISATVPENINKNTSWINVANIHYSNMPANQPEKSNEVRADYLCDGISISKKVLNNSNPEEEFTFNITLEYANDISNFDPNTGLSIESDHKNDLKMNIVKNANNTITGTFILKAGWEVSIGNIAAGTKYIVTEDTIYNYLLTDIDVQGGKDSSMKLDLENRSISGTIVQSNPVKIEFENTYIIAELPEAGGFSLSNICLVIANLIIVAFVLEWKSQCVGKHCKLKGGRRYKK